MFHVNTLQKKLGSNELILGAQAATMSPAVIEVFGDIGIDFVWIDLEHTGPTAYNSHSLERLTRAAKCVNSELLVRPHASDPHVIRKVLDTGIKNVILPRIETAEDVQKAISAAYFTYEDSPGERGSSIARGNNWGHRPSNFDKREDEHVMIGAMIENKRAVENIQKILDVSGLDFIRIGYGDLSVSVGEPFSTDHPKVLRLAEIAEEAAREHGVPISGKAHRGQDLDNAVTNGYNLMTIGNDLSILRDVLTTRRSEIVNQL